MASIPSSCGVYSIINLITGDRYIGGTTNMNQRKHAHWNKLRNGVSAHTKLQEAWLQYGADAFQFVVLEQVDDPDNLVAREQHYLDTLKPEYNTRLSADNSIGIPHDAKSRAKMSQALTGRTFTDEHRKNLGDSLRGRKRTPEQCERIRAAKQKVSAETRQKMSDAKKERTPWQATLAAAKKAKGKPRSPETIAKIKEAQRQRWAKRKQQEAQ